MNSSLQAALRNFIAREKLPPDYAATAEQWFIPLAEEVLRLVSGAGRAPIVGISGCQGSGKSTLAALLVLLMKEMMGLRAIDLSIDDFYLSRAARQSLSQQIHPLLATRGVPGTHDVPLAIDTLTRLRQEGSVAIPRFNKAVDDRLPEGEWPVVQAPVDVIVLEGWCLSIPAQDAGQLEEPVNTLEANEDADGEWRRYVNTMLNTEYGSLYGMVDYLIMLKAPDFARVKQWRGRQEAKLKASQAAGAANRTMNEAQLERFIQHYERITRHGLDVLPAIADTVFELTDEQKIRTRRK